MLIVKSMPDETDSSKKGGPIVPVKDLNMVHKSGEAAQEARKRDAEESVGKMTSDEVKIVSSSGDAAQKARERSG